MNSPVLVVIDVQREYVTAGRPFHIRGIEPSLRNIQKVLEYAREHGWRVNHIKHLQSGGTIFSPENEFSEFIKGFEPCDGEALFIKNDFSCFSSQKFCEAMEKNRDCEIIIVGYGSTMCCLSTIIDGYHRGYKMIFVNDASAAKATECFTEKQHHEQISDVMKAFAKVCLASEWVKS